MNTKPIKIAAKAAQRNVTEAVVTVQSHNDRIAIENVVCGVETYGVTDVPAVQFDVLVDGKLVVRTLELLNEQGDIVEPDDRNGYAWPKDFSMVAEALGADDENIVHDAIIARLAESLEKLPTSPGGSQGGDGEEVAGRIEAKVICTNDILGGGEYTPMLRVRLREDGVLTVAAVEEHRAEDAIPSHVWHRQTLQWLSKLSAGDRVLANKAALEELALDIAELAHRVHAGHTVDYDSGNPVVELTDDAEDAFREIWSLVENAEWTSELDVITPDEWFAEGMDYLEITASTTDTELRAMSDIQELNAEDSGNYIDGYLYNALEKYRDKLVADELEVA